MSAAWGSTPLGVPFARGLRCVVLVSASLAACAGDRVAVDAMDPALYYHRKLGYRITALEAVPAQSWKRVSVKGADLAYRSQAGDSMSISSSCRETSASAGILARKLMIGTDRKGVLAGGPVALGADQGWTQTIETREDGMRLRIKTVTLLSSGCVFDWVLLSVSPQSFETAEPVFDRWWRSFVAPESEGKPESLVGPDTREPTA